MRINDFPGKRLGHVFRQGPAARLPAGAEHPGLAGVVSGEGQKYCGNGSAMLEVYSPGDMQSLDYECGIWVPVIKPEKENESEAAEIISTMMITEIL